MGDDGPRRRLEAAAAAAAAAEGPGRSADGSGDTSAADFARIDPRDLEGLKQIGRGGFGVVYRARHRVWRIQLAVKSMWMDESDDHGLLEEAKKLHKAQFEYILRLYGITELCLKAGTKLLGLVTEFVENGSLENLIRLHEVPLPLRLCFVYEIALGMNFLHNLNPALYHHDLKPANILLNKEYHIKICDFGLAKWRKFTSQNRNNSPQNDGTISYMPPECFADINTRKDTKVDVYSYGIVIWGILTCKTPYEYVRHSALIKSCICNGDRPDLQQIPKHLLESCKPLIDLMKRCWAQNPNDRPPFSKCVNELEAEQRNDQELQQAVQVLAQQVLAQQLSNCVVVDCAPGSGGNTGSSSNLCAPVEEQNECTNFLAFGTELDQKAEQEAFATTFKDPNPRNHYTPTHFHRRTKSNKVSGIEQVAEPVQESTWKECKTEMCIDASQEKIVKDPLLVVTSNECMKLAKSINKDWKALARYLGLTDNEIDIIKYDHHNEGLLETVYQMLCKWKQLQGQNATRAQLVQGLKQIEKEYLWEELWS
ncbi:receptor-interacting serine/threonine-protein kinase 2-like [Rhinoraja longicauda]